MKSPELGKSKHHDTRRDGLGRPSYGAARILANSVTV
jgi:hypothetical protein